MQVRTEIEIDAPPERVWSVLLDFARYPEWNPFLVALTGRAGSGEKLQVTVSLPDSHTEREFRARVTRFEDGYELAWIGHLWMKGLLDGEHFFRLQPLPNGRTRFVHGEDFSGLLLKFVLSRLGEAARGFVYMNQALKKRIESSSRGATELKPAPAG
ncbi:MAG TPA: SRPBCC domain-containing protein [Polyangiaceae bacterium]|nr:SRPBCC domain-containing protein [Polyangiaceae bacterium]